jgi:hypothetical protein
MKKIFFSILIMVAVQTIFAQDVPKTDVIITKSAERIDAKIEEIGIDVVKYKRVDYVTGSSYTIKKADIASITYANGKVEVFSDKQVVVPSEPTQISDNQGNAISRDRRGHYVYNKDGVICQEGGNYYVEYGDGFKKTRLLINHYDDFLAETCPQAYSVYKKGDKLNRDGIKLGIAGGLIMGHGIIFTLAGALEDNSAFGLGLLFLGIAAPLVAASIPLNIKGVKLKRISSVNMYNEQCRTKNNTAMNISISPNTVGFMLKF